MRPTHYNGIKIRHLPPGVSGEAEERWPEYRTYSTWGRPPEGYETTQKAALRLCVSQWMIRKWCIEGRLEHLRRGTGRKTRLFVKLKAKPKR